MTSGFARAALYVHLPPHYTGSVAVFLSAACEGATGSHKEPQGDKEPATNEDDFNWRFLRIMYHDLPRPTTTCHDLPRPARGRGACLVSPKQDNCSPSSSTHVARTPLISSVLDSCSLLRILTGHELVHSV